MRETQTEVGKHSYLLLETLLLLTAPIKSILPYEYPLGLGLNVPPTIAP